MCYAKADEEMQRIERRWVNAKASLDFLFWPDMPLEHWHARAENELDQRLRLMNYECCLDVKIALNEDIHRAALAFEEYTKCTLLAGSSSA